MATFVDRPAHVKRVEQLLREHRVVGLVGARQVGKTTLARMVTERRAGPVHWFDLENLRDLARLEQPMTELEGLRGLVVLDEVQRRPELFPVLRVLVDRPRAPRYLVLGSASPALLRQTSESLAGRIFFHHVGGLSLAEVSPARADRLWIRGGFPRAFVARTERESFEWREALLRTFVERDLPQLGLGAPAASVARFWGMLAHWHGQVWNGSELGRAMGVADTSVRRWLDFLAGTFVVRVLPAFFENLAKRQVKSPKVYIADSGLLHALLGLPTRDAVLAHPKVGASWEGFALQVVVDRLGARPSECFFWATPSGAELDLLVVRGRVRRGFELKRADAPRLTPSMRIAMQDLRLDSLAVVYPGDAAYALADRIRVVPVSRVAVEVAPLR